MDKERIRIIISPELLERLGDDIEIRISLKGVEAKTDDGSDMLAFMEDVISKKKDGGKLRTAETYQTTLNRWRHFLSTESRTTLRWCEVTPQLINAFDAYLKRRKTGKNTLSFYMRILRAVCNRARREGHAVAEGLFRDVYTGKAKTRKRALPICEVRRIACSKDVGEKELFARDMFVFSFVTRGMATVDIAHLTDENICGGRLTYKRHKTEQTVTMAWLPEMQRIADTYRREGSKYLFPIIPDSGTDKRHEYKKLQLRLNYRLHKLGRQLGITLPLTMYVARHSWATIAKTSGVPTAVISDAMGHTSERTTQIYLDSIDSGTIDAANEKIVSSLFATMT